LRICRTAPLPQVAIIEPATAAGLDEPRSSDDAMPTNVQLGANYAASIINALDGEFIVEGLGFYLHLR